MSCDEEFQHFWLKDEQRCKLCIGSRSKIKTMAGIRLHILQTHLGKNDVQFDAELANFRATRNQQHQQQINAHGPQQIHPPYSHSTPATVNSSIRCAPVGDSSQQFPLLQSGTMAMPPSSSTVGIQQSQQQSFGYSLIHQPQQTGTTTIIRSQPQNMETSPQRQHLSSLADQHQQQEQHLQQPQSTPPQHYFATTMTPWGTPAGASARYHHFAPYQQPTGQIAHQQRQSTADQMQQQQIYGGHAGNYGTTYPQVQLNPAAGGGGTTTIYVTHQQNLGTSPAVAPQNFGGIQQDRPNPNRTLASTLVLVSYFQVDVSAFGQIMSVTREGNKISSAETIAKINFSAESRPSRPTSCITPLTSTSTHGMEPIFTFLLYHDSDNRAGAHLILTNFFFKFI